MFTLVRQNVCVPSRFASARASYGFLLVAIVVSYGLSVLSGTSDIRLSVLMLIELATVSLALRVSQATRLTRIAQFAIVVIAIALVISAVFGSTTGRLSAINHWLFVLVTLLYMVAPLVIVRHILERKDVDFEALLGVISAYLLIGMFFAFVYRLLGDWQSTPFFGVSGDGALADDLFFSFTTLTTVGYGNLVPAGNPGQTLAVFEAMIGQLFLVIVVAKVVTGLSGKKSRSDDRDGEPSV